MDLNETTVLKEINQDFNGEFLSARKNSSNNSGFPPDNLKENNNKFNSNLDKTFEQENFNFTDFEDKATVDNSNDVNVCEVSNNNENRNVEEIATNDKYLVRNPVNDTTIAGYSSDEETFAECNSYIAPEPKENLASPASSSQLNETVKLKCSKLSLTNLNFENLKIDDHDDVNKTQTNLEQEEKDNLDIPPSSQLNETIGSECTSEAFESIQIDDHEELEENKLESKEKENAILPPPSHLNETLDIECSSVSFEQIKIDEHEDLDKTTTEIVDDSKSEEDEEEGFNADETFEFEQCGLPNIGSKDKLNENNQFPSETSFESTMGKQIQDKDSGIFLENFVQNNLNVEFKVPNAPPINSFSVNQRWCPPDHPDDEKMIPGNEFNFDADAFDIFDKKSELGDIRPNRADSLLLRFDPLLNRPVPVLLDAPTATPIVEEEHIEEVKKNSRCSLQGNLLDLTIETDQTVAVEEQQPEEQEVISLNSTITEEESGDTNINDTISELQVRSPPTYDTEVIEVEDEEKTDDPESIKYTTEEIQPKRKSQNCGLCTSEALHTKHETMSVQMVNDVKTVKEDDPVIETIISSQSIKEEYKMAEIEKKLKNQGIKSEDNDRKLKEFESREEALIKRISEKEKVIAKMNSVIEAYETTISEFISEKAQITQRYEKKCINLQESSQLNASHLLSLEDTFSDLHTKYERSKQMAINFKQNEEKLLAEKKQLNELLATQEARYEKMKSHAMSQLQVANDKLENLSKNHAQELSKLKATLKKEEIARTAVAEQLQQKIRENEELVKICEELIGGGNVVSENS